MSVKLNFKSGTVELTHGAGGRAMAGLIDQLFRRYFDNDILMQQSDAAVIAIDQKKIAVSTDTYVVSPLFFAGGNIGSLAVNGTINDISTSGARALYLTLGLVIEAGFPLADLKNIIASMAEAAKCAGVKIITGDTKVVERGKGDGVFINTTGIGVFDKDITWQQTPKVGDKIILSGTLGDHGIAVLSKRQNLSFFTTIHSDSVALHGLVEAMCESKTNIRVVRDPTRGGLAATLNEWAHQFQCGIHILEEQLPIDVTVESACELLGLDPLNIANEGKLVAIVAKEDADTLLAAMRAHPHGQKAAIIGEIVADPYHFVTMTTQFGGQRMVDWLVGEQLPRIC